MNLSKSPFIPAITAVTLLCYNADTVASSNNYFRKQVTSIVPEEPKPVTFAQELEIFKEQVIGKIKRTDVFCEILTFSMNGQKMLLKLSYDNKTKTFTYKGLLHLDRNGGEVQKNKFPNVHKTIQEEITKLNNWNGWVPEEVHQ